MLTVDEIIKFLETRFPRYLAYEWDNVGLQIGQASCRVKRVMVALEATTPVINEAIEKKVDLIITHHPFIFSPLKAIDFATPQGKNIEKAIKNEIAIYAMHTNYDIAPGGMNDVLAEKIGLQDVKPFAMIDDIHGLGRIGELEQAMNIDSLSDIVRFEKLKDEIDEVRTVETVGSGCIKKVAVIGGSGGKYIHEAKAVGADILITGDVTYHTAVEAKEMGLNLIDIGHYAEVVMEEEVAILLNGQFSNAVQVIQSSVSKNPIL